jgi:mono/diheme cytochrome c family protein
MSLDMNQPVDAAAGSAEPRAGRAAAPVWLFVVLFVLIYWGMVYFDQSGAWFNEQVYTPYRSYDEVAKLQPRNEGGDLIIRGKQLFHDNCAVCHMDTGIGNPGNGCPNLAGSEWVSAPGPDRLIRLISKGMTGPIEVSGKVWSGGTMLAIGDQLPGDEKQKCESIAAIVSYIRKDFGNNASSVAPERVAAVRAKIANRPGYYSPDEIKATPENE